MKNEPMRGRNPDQSRVKSLYFLLQATARTLPITKNQRAQVNLLMPRLAIEVSDQDWLISFKDSDIPMKIVPKASFNFYKHSDDIEIARNNKVEAYKVLQDLFPDFDIDSNKYTVKNSRKNWIEILSSKIFPILLIMLLLIQRDNLTVVRASLITVLSILLFKIDSLKFQIIIFMYSVMIASFFPYFQSLIQIVSLIFLLTLIILQQISSLANQKNSYLWVLALILVVAAIILNQNFSLQIIAASISILLVVTFVAQMVIKGSSTIILILFFVAAISYTTVSFLESPSYLFILRFIATLPYMLFLTLRNRSNGLMPYLATYSAILTA